MELQIKKVLDLFNFDKAKCDEYKKTFRNGGGLIKKADDELDIIPDSENDKNFSHDNDKENNSTSLKKLPNQYDYKIYWPNVMFLIFIHIAGLYGYYLLLTQARTGTMTWFFFFIVIVGMGVTAGAHRFWSHRSYKARLPYEVMMMIFQTMSMQNTIVTWVRDHRVHHKYSETNADPHDSRRGFFFSHIGWLMCKKHPEFHDKKKNIIMDDLWNDPVVMFQYRYYAFLVPIFGVILPPLLPIITCNESIWVSTMTCLFTRYLYVLHSTWIINSVAHIWGMRQYDKSIGPSETTLGVYGSFGDGYHNYHHTFPYDYSASEFDWRLNINIATLWIDMFAALGMVYDRKTVSPSLVKNRVQRTGDLKQYDSYVKKITRQPATIITQILVAGLHFWIPLTIRYFAIKY